MIRDGRAVAHSNIVRSKDKMNSAVFKEYLVKWQKLNEKAITDCEKIGPNHCLRIKYEDLVLHPEKTLRNMIEFLDISWTDEFLNHQNHIGDDIQISKTEWSSHQIVNYFCVYVYITLAQVISYFSVSVS
jgi:protein-tyrosine sulfotransferase